MDQFCRELLALLDRCGCALDAWCVLPNHYHLLVESRDPVALARHLGQFHGRISFQWNGEEACRGRSVFYRLTDRGMRSDRHYWATVNYIHHNPVHHGYVESWNDWPWSSASEYLERLSRAEVRRIWHDYPLLSYGAGWDAPNL